MSKVFKYQILLHVVIFLWGYTAILGKWINLDALGIVWYRMGIAFLSLLVFMLILKKKILIKDKATAIKTIGVGFLVALHWLFFFLSVQVSTASLAIVCAATATMHVSWLEPLVMKRKFQASEFILSLLVVAGILIITFDSTVETNVLGIVFGLLAGLFAACFATFNGYLVNKTTAATITLYEMFSGFILLSICLILAPSFGFEELQSNLAKINGEDVAWLLFLGIICTSVAFLASVETTKLLGAFTVSLSINMEPIYTMIIAALFLNENEKVGEYFYLGAFLIVFAVFFNAIVKYYKSRRVKKASQAKA
ncbi:DMT family transporter [Lishizhenia sp.]|uniref:DMT family transporter n=1 Tax=Lishizhenia sp. TaxID=2497594 RepID=UPI00299E6899|nr:DMT family transporter [Lishizhenia sp.]MDX1444605.1 DMT family transporter [Lishizhenia sp.]